MLYLVSFLVDFSLLIFIFSATRLLAEQGASPLLLGAIGSAFSLASAVSNAVSGSISDQWGRRRTSLFGATVLLLTFTVVVFFGSGRAILYTAFPLMGLAAGMIYPSVIACLGTNRSGRSASRVYLFFCLSFNAGIVCAQVLGGWMFDRYGAEPTLVLGMIMSLLGGAVLSQVRDMQGQSSPRIESDFELGEAVVDEGNRRSQAFSRLAWTANFGGMFSMSVVWFLLPKLVVRLGVPADSHGAVLAAGRTTVMLTYCIMHGHAFWQYRFPVTCAFQLAGVAGLIGLATSRTTTSLFIGICGLSLMMGYNYFASLFYNNSGHAEDKKGRAFGLNEAFLGLGACGGSLLGGVTGTEWGVRAPFFLAATVVGVMIAAQVVLFRRIPQSRLAVEAD